MKDIYIRQGVYIDRLHSSIRRKLGDILQTYKANGNNYILITSTGEGNHSAGSFHYQHKAVDIKTLCVYDESLCSKAIEDEEDYLKIQLEQVLGNDYDVVIHRNSHIHVEFDIKGG